MKVLVTGGNGQLGQSIRKLQDRFPGMTFTYTDLEELDITDASAVQDHFRQHNYDYLVNCAAYNSVDAAEKEKEPAFRINEEAVGHLARSMQEQNGILIHISTDYVFSGRHFQPYIESDAAEPQSVYGRSKRAGEVIAQERCDRAIIVRTSWLYSEFGRNFMKTMLKLADEKEVLRVVSDQVGTPTYARDLAGTLLQLIQKNVTGPTVLHYSNEGAASWYDFAWEIIRLTKKQCRVLPVLTKDYPLPAPRPHYSLMSKEKIKVLLDQNIPHWKESLEECLQDMGTIR